ncbi:hypothetical protein MMC19_004200 [Ptychographa xylographoides]|nr:hypothetical protein [Ptychographa xylographoides]
MNLNSRNKKLGPAVKGPELRLTSTNFLKYFPPKELLTLQMLPPSVTDTVEAIDRLTKTVESLRNDIQTKFTTLEDKFATLEASIDRRVNELEHRLSAK